MDSTNYREFTRSPSQREVEVRSDSGILRGTLRDVSLKGLYVVCENSFPEGTTLTLTLGLGGESNAQIEIVGRVMRSDAQGMAIEIEELGVASYQHLKRLVLLNSGTPDAAEREIADHLGLKTRN